MKAKRLLTKLKFSAYKLKEGGQIPPSLFELICSVDDHNNSIEYVRELIALTEQLMRIKGFYFRFHESELGVDKIIKDFIEKSGKDN